MVTIAGNKEKRAINAFKRTQAINKIRKMRKRIRIIQGGTSAGKTYGILPVLIDRACKVPGIEISVVSETLPHLKKGAIKDFIKIMQQTGRWKRRHWHASDSKYTFNHKDGMKSTIEFFSVDNEAKVRGPRRNVLYVNEANNIKWETFYQLLIRTDMEIYIDYNPVAEFWAHEELMEKDNVEFLRLTYKDNDALPKTIVRELESNLIKAYHDPTKRYNDPLNIKNAYWANWCKVYLFGFTGGLQGAVYNNWKQVDDVPIRAKLLGYGLDFGYTNDPTALVGVYMMDGQYYFKQVIYQAGLKTREIVDLFKQHGVSKNDIIFADNSEPRLIDELKEYGYDVKAAVKGSGSVNMGIDVLQGITMHVTKDSIAMIKELRNYVWVKNKEGKDTNEPIDAYNHALDAARYFAIMRIAKRVRAEDVDVVYVD